MAIEPGQLRVVTFEERITYFVIRRVVRDCYDGGDSDFGMQDIMWECLIGGTGYTKLVPEYWLSRWTGIIEEL